MCRHCERLVEDVEHKQLVHDFMAQTAINVNRKINEDIVDAVRTGVRVDAGNGRSELLYCHGMQLQRPVTADDIDLTIHVKANFWHHNPFNGTRAQQEVYRMLAKMFE